MNQKLSFPGKPSIPRSFEKNDLGAIVRDKLLRMADKSLRFPICRTGSQEVVFA